MLWHYWEGLIFFLASITPDPEPEKHCR